MGESYGTDLRTALKQLFKRKHGDTDSNIRVQLLHDMQVVFGTMNLISSKYAVAQLGADADSVWSSWGRSPQRSGTSSKNSCPAGGIGVCFC